MSEFIDKENQLDFTDKCSWCKKQGLMWVLNHKVDRWFLMEKTGKRHIHQPQFDFEENNYGRN